MPPTNPYGVRTVMEIEEISVCHVDSHRQNTKHIDKISPGAKHSLCMQEKAKWSEEANNDVRRDRIVVYLPDSLDMCSENCTKTAVKQGGGEEERREFCRQRMRQCHMIFGSQRMAVKNQRQRRLWEHIMEQTQQYKCNSAGWHLYYCEESLAAVLSSSPWPVEE